MKKSRHAKDIPRVIVSVTMTLDGRVVTRSTLPLTGDPLLMRGVMMGFTGGKSPVAIRIIVNERGNFAPKSIGKLLANSGSLLLLCTGKEISDRIFRQLPPFVRVVEFTGGKIPTEALLGMLRSVWGVKLLLCEGEPSLLKPLLAADAVEELHVTIAPLIQGGSKAMTLTGHPDGFLPKNGERRFRLKSLKKVKGEVKGKDKGSGSAILHYLRDRRTAG